MPQIVKKKLKVLVLFDGTSPTTVDQDFTKELETKDWKTEADVMAALGALGHTAEHLAIYDNVDLVRQKLESFAPDILFNLVEQFPALSRHPCPPFRRYSKGPAHCATEAAQVPNLGKTSEGRSILWDFPGFVRRQR